MSAARLLVDIEVLEFLRTLRKPDQTAILKRFRELAAAPDSYIDYVENDALGRSVGCMCSAISRSNTGTTSRIGTSRFSTFSRRIVVRSSCRYFLSSSSFTITAAYISAYISAFVRSTSFAASRPWASWVPL